jgi:hypothetical protein
MEGMPDNADLRGIIPNAFQSIFAHIEKSKTQQYLVRASFLEIYNEDVRDLLAKNPSNKLEVKENPDSGVYVKDLTGFVVNGVSELNNVLAVGKKNRSVGATLMNQVRPSGSLSPASPAPCSPPTVRQWIRCGPWTGAADSRGADSPAVGQLPSTSAVFERRQVEQRSSWLERLHRIGARGALKLRGGVTLAGLIAVALHLLHHHRVLHRHRRRCTHPRGQAEPRGPGR